MIPAPAFPKIYHITHIDNITRIWQSGAIWSDAERIRQGLDCRIVGMSEIKRRRLEELEVDCHSDTKVGEYVPFYFCPRSIMLYILHRGNHPDIAYAGGQRPIVHLQADLLTTVGWADDHGIKWAFSDRNAGTRFAQFYNDLDDIDKVNWKAIDSTDFRSMEVKEGKQAEFLIWESFPYNLIEKVGVFDAATLEKVNDALSYVAQKPTVSVETGWYF